MKHSTPLNSLISQGKALVVLTALSSAPGLVQLGTADGLITDYTAIPPLISTLGSGDKPNILVVLDDSNSMDEAPGGVAVGSDNPGSKSEIARAAVKNLMTNFTGRVRMGLMAYQQSGITARDIHAAYVDVSFDPANYDPSYDGPRDSLTKRFRAPNTTNTGAFMYYNLPLPLYSSGNLGTAFCYSSAADFDNGSETYPGGPWDIYDCYRSRTHQTDDPPPGHGWNSYWNSFGFTPTDTDLAQGVLDFGTVMTWNYVGPTWFANSSPGGGYLHVAIDELDAAQATLLNKKLATSQFATATDTPLRNAGLTPIEGTLLTAKKYYDGTSLLASEGGPTSAPAGNVCGDKDFVVLVTDGLPSTDKSGNVVTDPATAIAGAAAAAADLLASGVRTYVVGFALPAFVDATLLNKIAAAGGTAQAFLASDKASLSTALDAVFLDVINKTSSSTGAAVVSNNSAGIGALYQALYIPKFQDLSGNQVTWAGMLHSVFIDDYGFLREDGNGNHKLDGYDVDKIIQIYFDAGTQSTRVRRYTSSSATAPAGLTAESSVALAQMKPVWNARDQLAVIANANTVTQRNYDTVASDGRHILTWIDADDDGVVDAGEEIEFSAAAIDADAIATGGTGKVARYFAVNTDTEAKNVVDFVRGKEGITGFRSRTVDYDADKVAEVWRLGDIVHSTPVNVGAPADRYDLIYGDHTYAAYRAAYAKRRQVVYVGANDGMIHAFNAGFWNNLTRGFDLTDASATATKHPLGSELWAYVPMNLLPHLQWLTDPAYPHVYYVDGTVRAFDVNIFAADAVHPGGWGTILVVPMRFGGGPFSIDKDGDGTKETTLRSAVVVLDVTNPEDPPVLIAEITDDQLGFTTSLPALIKAREEDISTIPSTFPEAKDNWYLVFGSGPNDLSNGESTQTAGIFIYDLESRAFVTGFDPKDLGLATSFVGDPSVVDWDKSYIDDSVYFGSASGTAASPSGALQRLKLASPITGSTPSSLVSPSQPFVSAPFPIVDNKGANWLYAGTGRLFAAADNTSLPQQTFFGVKEPVRFPGDLDAATWTPSGIALGDIVDVTSVKVFEDGSILPVNPSGLTASSFKELETAIEGKAGWKINLTYDGTNPSGRNLNEANRVGKVLLFTEYVPANNSCEPEGVSRLFGVNYKTGTGMPSAPLGVDKTTTNNGTHMVESYIPLGQGAASAPVVHHGKQKGAASGNQEVTVITQQSTGEITGSTVTLPGLSSGRQTWMQLDF